MKSTGRDPLLVDVFSKEFCDSLLEEVRELHEARWVHRKNINSRPTKGDVTSDYYFCGNHQFPKEMREALMQVAPQIEGCELGEVIINRYDVDGYMPEHVDVSPYRYNMVVALSDCGDGLTIRDEWHEDVPGRACIFPAFSAPHEVPPVKSQRFVLIYLYE